MTCFHSSMGYSQVLKVGPAMPGVVDQDIDMPEVADGRRDAGVDGRHVGDVDGRRVRRPSGQASGRRLGGFGIHVPDADRRPLAGEAGGDGEADAAGAAGDHGDAAAHVVCRHSLISPRLIFAARATNWCFRGSRPESLTVAQTATANSSTS